MDLGWAELLGWRQRLLGWGVACMADTATQAVVQALRTPEGRGVAPHGVRVEVGSPEALAVWVKKVTPSGRAVEFPSQPDDEAEYFRDGIQDHLMEVAFPTTLDRAGFDALVKIFRQPITRASKPAAAMGLQDLPPVEAPFRTLYWPEELSAGDWADWQETLRDLALLAYDRFARTAPSGRLLAGVVCHNWAGAQRMEAVGIRWESAEAMFQQDFEGEIRVSPGFDTQGGLHKPPFALNGPRRLIKTLKPALEAFTGLVLGMPSGEREALLNGLGLVDQTPPFNARSYVSGLMVAQSHGVTSMEMPLPTTAYASWSKGLVLGSPVPRVVEALSPPMQSAYRAHDMEVSWPVPSASPRVRM